MFANNSVLVDRGADARTKDRLPETMYLDWTDYCNAKCFFCNREIYEQQIGGRGTFIPFSKLKMLEKPLRAVKYFGISSGIGEPLLHPELEQILDWLYEINPRIKIRAVTNGTALTAAKARWFAGHLDWLSISLNASNAEAHLRDMFPHLAASVTDPQKRWELHLRHITEFVAALPPEDRPRIRLQAVAHRRNLDDLVDFVRLTANLGISHAVIPNIAVHENTVDYSLYWVKDQYNDVIDEAAAVGSELGVRVDAARFYTTVKPVLDLDKVCRDPIDIAYISRASVGAPCCQWAEAGIPIDVYSDEAGFERYWNHAILRGLRAKRDAASCKVCGMARVFDETSFHFSPKLKKDLMEAHRIAQIDAENDYPDAVLVRRCVENRLDLPTVRRTLLGLNLPVDEAGRIEREGLGALPILDQACWEAFRTSDGVAGPVDLALAGPFAGIGWGPPIHEPHNQVSARWLSNSGIASVFVRVPPGSNYELQLTIHTIHPASLHDELKLGLGDQVLETGHFVDENGRVVLHAILPRRVVDLYGGRLWVRIGCLGRKAIGPLAGHVSFTRLRLLATSVSEIPRPHQPPYLLTLFRRMQSAVSVRTRGATRRTLIAVLTRLSLLDTALRTRERLRAARRRPTSGR